MEKVKIRNSKEVTQSIIRGLNEAIKFAKNPEKSNLRRKQVEFIPLPEYNSKDVKMIRSKLSLTQRNFANSLGVSIKTVESWESDRNVPSGPAQRILYLLNKKPQLIREIKV